MTRAAAIAEPGCPGGARNDHVRSCNDDVGTRTAIKLYTINNFIVKSYNYRNYENSGFLMETDSPSAVFVSVVTRTARRVSTRYGARPRDIIIIRTCDTSARFRGA